MTTQHPTTDPSLDELRGLLPAGCPLPDEYAIVAVRHELHDDIPVTVIRAQPTPPLRYGGEHLTTVVGRGDHTLYGYTRQTPTRPDHGLPTESEARQVAFAFLHDVDPTYAAGLTEQWIDRHDETITTPDGHTRPVCGMKVKTRHDDGRYAWVIIGPGPSVITYERHITWNSAHARRQTPMWLHDRWVTTHDHGGPDLPPPAAPTRRRTA